MLTDEMLDGKIPIDPPIRAQCNEFERIGKGRRTAQSRYSSHRWRRPRRIERRRCAATRVLPSHHLRARDQTWCDRLGSHPLAQCDAGP
jgi:hypothetical protein